jgi:hypothetical protein
LTFETHVSQSKKANKTRELGADCDSLWNRGSTPKPLTAAIIVINNDIIDFNSIFRVFVGKLIGNELARTSASLKNGENGHKMRLVVERREIAVAKGWSQKGGCSTAAT